MLRQYQPWTAFGPRHLPETDFLCAGQLSPRGAFFGGFYQHPLGCTPRQDHYPPLHHLVPIPRGCVVYGFMLWHSSVCNEIIIL